jgi:cytochrome c oxidase cbb3-type subunit III
MRKFSLFVWAVAVAGLLPFVHLVRADDAAMAKAHENYMSYCAKCHGEQGKGDGAGAAMLNPKPRDYTNCSVMQGKSDDELFKVISEGGESIGMSADMQPWGGTLSAAEIHDMVKFVRGFCKPAEGSGTTK